ncbi:MAG: histidine kinase [Flavobacteriales bacterium]
MELYDQAFAEFKRIDFMPGAHDAMASISALLMEAGHSSESAIANQTAKKYPRYENARYGYLGKSMNRSKTDYHPIPVGDANTLIDDSQATPTNSDVDVLVPQSTIAVERYMVDAAPQQGDIDTVKGAAELMPSVPVQVLRTAGRGAAMVAEGVDTAVIASSHRRIMQPVRRVGGMTEARDELEVGEAWVLFHDQAKALTSFERSRSLFRASRSDSGECLALLRIGELRGNRGEFERAFAVLDSARLKARTIGRADLEGLALAGMGDMCRRIEECGGASELYRRSIELAQLTGDKRTESRGYLGMTEGLLKSGAPTQAAPLGQRGLAIATELGDPDLRQQGAKLLQGVYTELGRLQEADEMDELVLSLRAFIERRDRAMDSIVQAMRSDFARIRQEDSLAHWVVQSALESNWKGEKAKATMNRRAAFVIGISAAAIIIAGWMYYRLDRRRRQRRAERKAMELEMRALRAQMNPHFLFNALTSIHMHILENEAEVAAEFLTKFTKLMRQVLEMSRLNDVSLKRELEVLGLYAELEQMRLKGRFRYLVEMAHDVDPETVSLPPMLLQPFVENAVWHGLAGKKGLGCLRVAVTKANSALHVTIEDDGCGRQDDKASRSGHTSLGTSITKERLDLWATQSGAPATFSYVPVPVGTRVLLVLPWTEGP